MTGAARHHRQRALEVRLWLYRKLTFGLSAALAGTLLAVL